MNEITAPRRIDQPEPGLFRLRIVKGGPFVAARIKHGMGFWSAEIDGQPCGAAHTDPAYADGVFRIWTSGTPIDAAEYAALRRRPPMPADKPVDFSSLAPISFEDPADMNAMPALHGANVPTIDLAAALEPEALAAWLAEQYADLAERKDALLAANDRFLRATAAGITTDPVAERATDFARQIRAAIKETDDTRVAIKAPVLAAQRAIDSSAKAITDPLAAATAECERRVTVYLRAKDIEARRLAAEAAARAEELARQLSEEAANTDDADAWDVAATAAVEAETAAAQATAPTAELTRMRTSLGTTTSLRDRWVFELTDIASVPTHFLMLNEAAVKAAIKGGARHIPGLAIRNEPRAGIR